VTRGDPQSPLRWTCKSTRRLAQELTRQGHPVGPRSVAALLKAAGYSLMSIDVQDLHSAQGPRII
jgi:hypothetical protein